MVEDSHRRADRNRRTPEARARGRSAPNIILTTEVRPRTSIRRPSANAHASTNTDVAAQSVAKITQTGRGQRPGPTGLPYRPPRARNGLDIRRDCVGLCAAIVDWGRSASVLQSSCQARPGSDCAVKVGRAQTIGRPHLWRLPDADFPAHARI
jgi:hypothetical protein